MGRKILIVDDDWLIFYLLKRRLEKRGYDVVGAKDEKEFWERAFDPDLRLIILDICLKNRAGTAVYQALLDFGMNTCVPVIFTTGRGNDPLMAGLDPLKMPAERSAFLPKPIDFEKLNQAMERLLQSKVPRMPQTAYA